MRIGILLASFDWTNSWFSYDLAALVRTTVQAHPDWDLPKFQASGTWLPQVRHDTVAAALNAGCDWLLFLDSDMRFPADTLLRLLDRGQPVVACNYTSRHFPNLHPTAVRLDGSRIFTDEDSTGLEEAGSVGMGVMLVQAALPRLIELPWFMIGWTGKAYSGEDSYFCRQLRDAGAHIWVDHDASQDVEHMAVVPLRQSHAVRPKLVEVT